MLLIKKHKIIGKEQMKDIQKCTFRTLVDSGESLSLASLLEIIQSRLFSPEAKEAGVHSIEFSATVTDADKFPLNRSDFPDELKKTFIRYNSIDGVQKIYELSRYIDLYSAIGNQILGFGDEKSLEALFPIDHEANQSIYDAYLSASRRNDPTQFHENIGMLSEQNPLTPLCHGLDEEEPSRNFQNVRDFLAKHKFPIITPYAKFGSFDEIVFEPIATNVQPKPTIHPAQQRLKYKLGDPNPRPGQRQRKKGQEPRA
jgi:hypothetical protein